LFILETFKTNNMYRN